LLGLPRIFWDSFGDSLRFFEILWDSLGFPGILVGFFWDSLEFAATLQDFLGLFRIFWDFFLEMLRDSSRFLKILGTLAGFSEIPPGVSLGFFRNIIPDNNQLLEREENRKQSKKEEKKKEEKKKEEKKKEEKKKDMRRKGRAYSSKFTRWSQANSVDGVVDVVLLIFAVQRWHQSPTRKERKKEKERKKQTRGDNTRKRAVKMSIQSLHLVSHPCWI